VHSRGRKSDHILLGELAILIYGFALPGRSRVLGLGSPNLIGHAGKKIFCPRNCTWIPFALHKPSTYGLGGDNRAVASIGFGNTCRRRGATWILIEVF